MKPEILGIVLVRNEDRFLETALRNAAGFCDRFLLFDHQSADRSPQILEDFARGHAGSEFRRILHPAESHEAIRPLAGKPVWIFGVDGDEIYDPDRLTSFRARVLSGEFDDFWMVMGHCLHTERIRDGQATGFMAPPSRSITKLYNFAAIDAWPGKSVERLHGGRPVFRSGFDASRKKLLFEESSWDDSPLRCLHACFCRRSSLDSVNSGIRKNIDELYNRPSLVSRIRKLLQGRASGWKMEKYRRGGRVTVGAPPFFLSGGDA